MDQILQPGRHVQVAARRFAGDGNSELERRSKAAVRHLIDVVRREIVVARIRVDPVCGHGATLQTSASGPRRPLLVAVAASA